MPNNISQPPHSYLGVARRISEASDIEIVEILHQLRDKRELSRTVRALNALLQDSAHNETAWLALRRLGLEHAG